MLLLLHPLLQTVSEQTAEPVAVVCYSEAVQAEPAYSATVADKDCR